MAKIKITHSTGLHARPAGLITKEAQKYQSEITIMRMGQSYNAKSIMSILSMGAVSGDELEIVAEGTDAQLAEQGIVSIVEHINAE